MSAPSAWRMEQVMSVCMSLRQRLINEDLELATDAEAALAAMGEPGADAEELIKRLIQASLEANAYAEAAKARAADISERAKRYTRRAEAFRGAAFAAMDALEIRKLEDAEFTASIRAGSSRAVVTNEADVPEEFWRVSRSIAQADINAAIKAGRSVPGVEITNAMPSLTIRSR